VGRDEGLEQIVVAVIDTGVDAKHRICAARSCQAGTSSAATPDPADDQGTAPRSQGVIGARSNNRAGVAGICWRCLVMPIKVLDSKGNGDDTLIAAGIVWAVNHGARVLNLSLGGPGSSVELGNALTYAASKGVVVVAAAGNAGGTTQFFRPLTARGQRRGATVADQRYTWSNFGSWVRLAARAATSRRFSAAATTTLRDLVRRTGRCRSGRARAERAAATTAKRRMPSRAAFPLPAFVRAAGSTRARRSLLGSSPPVRKALRPRAPRRCASPSNE
jgi:hypothetical protein